MNLAQRWLDKWHWIGKAAPNQFQFYRCELCRSIVTWKRIKTNGECKCAGSRFRPTNLTFMEKFRLLCLPWTV